MLSVKVRIVIDTEGQTIIASNIPDGHSRAGNLGKADGSRETLVTLRIIVLEADLELDGLEEVSLLGLQRIL